SKNIIADTGNKRDTTTKSRRRHGLARALAARVHEEGTSDYSLSGRRKLFRLDDHVGVRTADNVDGYTHKFSVSKETIDQKYPKRRKTHHFLSFSPCIAPAAPPDLIWTVRFHFFC